MLKTSVVLLKKSCRLLVSLIVAAALFTAGGSPALGQDDSAKTSAAGKEPTADTTMVATPPGMSGAVSQPETTQPILPYPSTSAEKWMERYETLMAGLSDGSLDEKDADKLYQEVNEALGNMRNRLRGLLESLDARESSGKKAALPEETANKEHQEVTPGTDSPKDSASL